MPRVLKPQKGPQEKFLSSSADIVFFGGSAGGGKSFGMLLTPLRYMNVKGFTCTIFRKNYNQIFSQGALWDEAFKVYSGIKGAVMRKGEASWTFVNSKGEPCGKVSFAHIERFEEVQSWHGSQIAMIGFDEVTHFSEDTFFYMLSRNRSTCGVKPFVRATCNPDADSWVADFISWWIDPVTGYPIPERGGVIRYFIRRENEIFWADTKKELWEKFDLKTKEERDEPKSFTFIPSSIYDNKELLKSNPQYLANLKALATVERERLLMGNWKIKPSAGTFFKRSQIEVIDVLPKDIQSVCRAWDLAATEDKPNGDPDYTAGVLMGIRKDRSVVVIDVINLRLKAGDVENLIYNTAMSDRATYGFKYKVRIPVDPGAAGKIVANTYIKKLSGFSAKSERVTGSKQSRATPFATQWQNGNVQVMAASWNESYFDQLESFPESKHDDMVDASSDAFNEVTSSSFTLKSLI